MQEFKAVLKGNYLEWADEVPEIGDRPTKVYVTIIEDSDLEPTPRGQKMAGVLEKLAAQKAFAQVDPAAWQREIRQDRSLPDRNG